VGSALLKGQGNAMTRTRCVLFSVALFALLVSGAPAFAGTGSLAAPSGVAPATAPSLASSQCTQPAPQNALPAIAAPDSRLFLETPAPADFILCSCSYCRKHPDVVCQISPSGFSILCSDYYASRCV
jgi:hypothetical protein